MIFASTELAARIEAAECRLIAECTRAAGASHPEVEVVVQPVAGGVACYAGPGSPLDKVVGLGFAGPVDEGELAAIELAFATRDCPVQVELSSLAAAGLSAMLCRRGYVLESVENVLGRPLEPAERPDPTAIEVSHDEADDSSAWLDVVVSGFAVPDDQGVASHEQFPREILERAIGDMASARGFTRWLARRGGQLAGAGGLRVDEGIAHLCGASTLPAHRRRGVQTALLATRLAHAASAGCDLAVMITMPGSRSQHNAQRRGFSLLYTRSILVRPPG